MNMYLHEQVLAEHRHDVQREVEQQRIIARLSSTRQSTVRHTIGSLGTVLIVLGTRLRQIELRNERVATV